MIGILFAAAVAAAIYVILCFILCMVQDRLPYFPTPAANPPGAAPEDRGNGPQLQWLVKDAYDSARRMQNVRAPVLMVIAARDDVIHRARSDALVAATPSQLVRVQVFLNATHHDINLQPGYREAMRRFLDGYLPRPAS